MLSRYLKKMKIAPDGVALLVLTFLYAGSASRHLLGGDNGEFLTIAALGGLAHPPGYPFYSVYLRPFGASLWLTQASSALPMVVALWLLHRTSVRLSGSRAAAWCVTAWLAVCPLVWVAATHAEVFAWLALFSAMIVHEVLAVARPRMWVCAAAFGLSVVHHHTVAGLLPLVLAAARRPSAREIGFSLAAFLAPLGLLLAMPSLATSGWHMGDPVLPGFVWQTLFRTDYGTFSLSALNAGVSYVSRLKFITSEMVVGTSGLFVASLAGGWLAFRRGPIEKRLQVGAWLSALLCGPLFALTWALPLDLTGAAVARRFVLLPVVLVAPFAAVAVHAAKARVSLRARTVVVSVVSAVALLLGARAVRDHHRETVEAGLRIMLKAAPKNGILVGAGDHRLFGFLYLQRVLRERPDVTFVNTGLLHEAWYRDSQELLRGLKWPPSEVAEPPSDPLLTTILRWQAEGKDVWLLDSALALRLRLPFYPYGPFYRLLRPGQEMPNVDELAALNAGFVAQFGALPDPSPDRTSFAGAIQDDFSRPALTLYRAYVARSQPDKAAPYREEVIRLAPWFDPGQNKP